MPPTGAINENFDAIGFSSMYFIYNSGSIMISILAVPVLALIVGILRPCIRYRYPLCLYRKVKSYVFWNGTFQTITGTYTILVMCVLINTKHVSLLSLIILAHLRDHWWNYQFLLHNTVRNHPLNLPCDCLLMASKKFWPTRRPTNLITDRLHVQWSWLETWKACTHLTGVFLRAQSTDSTFGCL